MADDKLLAEYLETCKRLAGFKPRTLAIHRRICSSWCAFLAEHSTHSLDFADPEDLLAFIEHRERAGVKTSTIRGELCVLRGLYRYLHLHGKILWDPAASLPKMICDPPAEKEYLTIEECVSILKSFDTTKEQGLRSYVIVALLWSTGLRNRELGALTWADIDLDEATLLVRYGKGGKQRQLFLNERLQKDLMAYRARLGGEDHEPVFFSIREGKRQHLSASRTIEIVRESARSAGITRPVTPLTFRHTFATHMFEAGATTEEIKELLGHDDETETTIYIHVSLDAAKRLLNDHLANPFQYDRGGSSS